MSANLGLAPIVPATRASLWPSLRVIWLIVARVICGPRRDCRSREAGLAAGIAVRPIWYYLLASALMLTCWEWFLVPAPVDRLMGTVPMPSEFGIELTRPWWLLACFALPVLFFYFRRSLVDLRGGRGLRRCGCAG